MAGSRHWLRVICRTFAKSSCKSMAALDVANVEEDRAATAAAADDTRYFEDERNRRTKKKQPSVEDIASIKIQACFRGHLARRAFRALRSVVKIQALVRGVCVRRQTRIAIRCMQAMVRLQVRIQARQLLKSSGEFEHWQPKPTN